jgi:hypothetical protein
VIASVPVEEIASLAGHTKSRTTELVYRHQLRPVMEKGAQAIDQLFSHTAWPLTERPIMPKSACCSATR